MLYCTDTEFGLTAQEVARRLPNVSFHSGMDLSAFGFLGYRSVPPPTADGRVQEVFPEMVDGVLTQAWEVVPFSPEVYALRLTQARDSGIERTYSDVNAVTFAAVGNRVEEYRAAEESARAFAASNYEGEPDELVASHALYNLTGSPQTNRWAADSIIAQADQFRAAQKAMRSMRFQKQAQLRAATTAAEVADLMGQWGEFIADLRRQLGQA